MNENAAIQTRTIGAVTLEIRTLHAQAQQLGLNYAIEIGRRLVEAKELLPHGAWGEYLKTEVRYSQSTAQNLMKIFDKYGADQQSLLGPVAKSQTLGNLPYTKALTLLALPSDEREDFIESHDVEGMSTRELKEAIRARDEALKKAEEHEQELQAANEMLESQQSELEAAQAVRELAEKYAADTAREVEELRAQLEQMESIVPDIAIETIVDKEAVEAAAAAAKKDAEEKLRAKIEKAEKAKEKAEQAKNKAEQDLNAMKVAQEEAAAITEREKQAMAEQVQTLQKRLAVASSSEMTIFKLHFEQGQASINKMVECIGKMMDGGDAEGAGKLKKALAALLSGAMDMVK